MWEEARASHLSKLKYSLSMKYCEWEKSMKTQESWSLPQTGLNVISESKDCNTTLMLTHTNSWCGPLCASALRVWCVMQGNSARSACGLRLQSFLGYFFSPAVFLEYLASLQSAKSTSGLEIAEPLCVQRFTLQVNVKESALVKMIPF